MPADFTVNLNDVIEATMFQEYQGSTILNVFHYKVVTNLPITTGRTFLTNFLGNWAAAMTAPVTGYRTLVVDTFNFRFARAQVVKPQRSFFVQQNLAVSGSVVGTGIPSDTHIKIAYRTDAAGRGKTGNKRMTGLARSSMTGAEFDGPTVAAWQSWSVQSLNQVIPDPLDLLKYCLPIVWSPKRPNDRREPLSSDTDTLIHVARRRLRGIGI